MSTEDQAMTRTKLIELLKYPPAPKCYHRDRIAWDQAELIADAIMERFAVQERPEGDR